MPHHDKDDKSPASPIDAKKSEPQTAATDERVGDTKPHEDQNVDPKSYDFKGFSADVEFHKTEKVGPEMFEAKATLPDDSMVSRKASTAKDAEVALKKDVYRRMVRLYGDPVAEKAGAKK